MLTAPRVQKYLHHRMYTDTAHGGLGQHTASWPGMCALIQLVQKALCLPGHKMPSQTQDGHMPHMVEWCRKTLLFFGMEMGRLPRAHSSAPGRHPSAQGANMTTSMTQRIRMTHAMTHLSPNDAYAPSNQRREPHHLTPIHHAAAMSGTKLAPQVRPPGTPMAASYRHEQELGSSTVRCASNLVCPTHKQYTGQKCTAPGVWIAATLARPGNTIVLDNKAVTRVVTHEPAVIRL